MSQPNQSQKQPIFLAETVVKGGRNHVRIAFDTLIFQKRERPFDWYKNLGLDKSQASKIRRGVIVPPRWLRIKIADYFKVDSSTIWFPFEMILADGKGTEA